MKKLFSLLTLFLAPAFLLLIYAPNIAEATTFRRPLTDLLNPAISYFYDHDVGVGAQNYLCGANRVYNNHRGTDFRTGDNRKTVVAAATGSVYYRYDNCPTYGSLGSNCGGGFGNHARLDHEGAPDGLGWVTIYAHLERGSVVLPNQSVACSVRVGRSGSSGNSSAPHLHFEVRKYAYPNNDPFTGPCGGPQNFWTSMDVNGMPWTQCEML